MAVVVVSSTRHYVGLSTDIKPTPGYPDATGVVVAAAAVPVGATYFVADPPAADNGVTYTWNGTSWVVPVTLSAAGGVTALVALQVESNEWLQQVVVELTALRLAMQETYNEGRPEQQDFRELALTLTDRSETEEP